MRFALIPSFAALLLGLAVSSAAPVSAADTNAVAAAPEAAQSSDDAAGCPGKMNGAPCCASCQAEQTAGEVAPAAKAPCPCQERARRLREAAERAKQQ